MNANAQAKGQAEQGPSSQWTGITKRRTTRTTIDPPLKTEPSQYWWVWASRYYISSEIYDFQAQDI